MPLSRPMPSVGPRCYELRIRDESRSWRVFYRVDTNAVVVAEVAAKKTAQTPLAEIQICKRRLAQYDRDRGD